MNVLQIKIILLKQNIYILFHKFCHLTKELARFYTVTFKTA